MCFPAENACSCRKMRFPAEKCGFRGAGHRAGNCRKLQELCRAQESRTLTNFHKKKVSGNDRRRNSKRQTTLGNIPVTTTTKIFPKALRYKWEAYCDTNGRRIAKQMAGVLTLFPFPQSVGAPEVLQYKLEAYCNTNWRCIAILFLEVVVVVVTDILLTNGTNGFLQNFLVSCRDLRFPAVFCENLRLPNAVLSRKTENLQKSAKQTKKNSGSVFSLLVCPF